MKCVSIVPFLSGVLWSTPVNNKTHTSKSTDVPQPATTFAVVTVGATMRHTVARPWTSLYVAVSAGKPPGLYRVMAEPLYVAPDGVVSPRLVTNATMQRSVPLD